MKQYQEEKSGDEMSMREEGIKVGRGVKGPSLHGKSTAENKKAEYDKNAIEADGDIGLDIRKAKTLDYIEGNGDEDSDPISERMASFKSMNPEWIHYSEVDELYPTHKD